MKKRIKSFLKYFLWTLLAAFIAFNIYILASGNVFFYKAVWYNFAGIDDYKIFNNRTIGKSTHPQPWPVSNEYNKKKLTDSLTFKLQNNKSVAFLIIKDDSLFHEQYWDGYSNTSFSNSFSVAKSYVSALVGAAMKEGKIKSIDQYVYEYLPEFNNGEKKNIKIRHLLTMSSGLEWNEAYADPLSVTTEAYYGNNLPRIFQKQKVEGKPGVEFSYKSGDTQLLGFIIEKATGKSLAEYAHEKLWEPMGAENDALWSLDHEGGHEKAYCCINSNARDFARLGYLYLHKGNWKGIQLIDSSYVEATITPAPINFLGVPEDFYGFQWWLIPDYRGKKVFYARGILGQLIIVIPEWNIVAVRLGESRGAKVNQHFGLVYDILEGIEALLKAKD